MTEDTRPIREDAEPGDEEDTEGHYLATYEYGRLVSRERAEEAERSAREARLRQDDRKGRRQR